MAPIGYILFGFLLGSGVGITIGWLLSVRARPPASSDLRLEQELRQQLAQREAEVAQARSELGTTQHARVAAESGRAAAETALADQRTLNEQQFAQLRVSTDRALADVRETFNPYAYPGGLFDGGLDGADFTVAAVHRSNTMGNWFTGVLGGLAVYDRALSDDEMWSLFDRTSR